jgi:hypothetical protein
VAGDDQPVQLAARGNPLAGHVAQAVVVVLDLGERLGAGAGRPDVQGPIAVPQRDGGAEERHPLRVGLYDETLALQLEADDVRVT